MLERIVDLERENKQRKAEVEELRDEIAKIQRGLKLQSKARADCAGLFFLTGAAVTSLVWWRIVSQRQE